MLYVLDTFIKWGSATPANDINLDFFFKLSAKALAIEVFPVPGGPCSKITNPYDVSNFVNLLFLNLLYILIN